MNGIEIKVTELHEITYILVIGINKYFREGPVHCMVIKSGIREPLFFKEEFEEAQE